MNILALYIFDFGLILGLYAIKALAFRYLRSAPVILGTYCAAIALVIPLAWLTSPDWDNELVLRISVWVGVPVGLFCVPVASFLFDFISCRRSMDLWYVRIPFEVLLLVPIWLFLWINIMLGFGWLSDV